MQYPILITDVSPRDGLQNEPEILPVAVRVALIERLLAAGVPRIELGSFVNPKQVPQMAGSAEVAAELQAHGHELRDRRRFTALIPNMKGYELATAAGLGHVRLVLAASEGLNQANFKRSVADSLADFAHIAARAQADGIGFGIAIGAAFGCPFDGYVAPERVRDIAAHLIALGADELILADTTGMAVPTQVAHLSRILLDGGTIGAGLAQPIITLHLHNTRNTGYANAFAAWQAGIRSFDASLGGIGGCPFAPRAVGNIATEDTVHMLNGIGAATGIDLAALIAAADWLSEQMHKSLPALVGKAEPVFAQVTAP
ncbi:MAG: hydroxymethylglutaryl-CoA lyase [Oscillochloris sp.]|nr:hydroxymethylglutaryl-CoA lyase [Oscillochloris sp.]